MIWSGWHMAYTCVVTTHDWLLKCQMFVDHYIILGIFMTCLWICNYSQNVKCLTLSVLLQLFTRIPKELILIAIQTILLWVSVNSFVFFKLHDGCLFSRLHYLQVFVGGLDPSVTDDLLKQTFSPYGELLYVKIPVGKRCGFVQYSNRYEEYTLLCCYSIASLFRF
jgi:hypothetical protein